MKIKVKQLYLLGIIIVFIVILALIYGVITGFFVTTSTPVNVSAENDPFVGPADAKVTIIEFSDYQCSACRAAEPVVEQIIQTYKDRVKFVYRDFPLSFHSYAEKAAEASECAHEQGKFWEYHGKLMSGALDEASLKQYAKDLGLNTEQFNSCLDSGKYYNEVQKDLQDGLSYGVDATPTFFINGIEIVGGQSFSVFQRVIESELLK